MTQRQKKLLDFIRDRIEATGVAPSYTEMAAAIGTSSRTTPHDIVQRLIADGHLVRRADRRHRGIELPGPNLAAVPIANLKAEIARRIGAAQ